MQWYGKIENGQIVEIREFEEPDALLLSKMMKGGTDWRIGEDGEYSFDPDTQIKDGEPIYDIQETKIVRTYAVKDKASTDYGKVEEAEVTDVRTYPCPAFPAQLTWLSNNGYKVIEDGDSSYDPVTQTRTTDPTYDIQAAKIVRTYAVADKSLADAKEAKLADIRSDARSTILAAYPSWYQDNVALGIYGSDIGSPMKTHIENIIVQSNTCENAVDAAETVAVVRGISPDWPVE